MNGKTVGSLVHTRHACSASLATASPARAAPTHASTWLSHALTRVPHARTDADLNPCIGIMSSLASMTQDESQSDISRVLKQADLRNFWVPEPRVEPADFRKTTLERSFQLETRRSNASWDDLDSQRPVEVPFTFVPPMREARREWGEHVARMRVEETHELIQRHFYYFYYPFDSQALMIDFQYSDFHATTCGMPVDGGEDSFVDADTLDEVVSAYGQFELDKSCDALQRLNWTAFELAVWRGNNGVVTIPKTFGCQLVVCLKRRPASYLLQFLIPSSLVTLSTLFALVISPIEPDLATARASILLVAMLLLVEAGSGVWRGTFQGTWVEQVTRDPTLLPEARRPPL
jgi:hypothetical protein